MNSELNFYSCDSGFNNDRTEEQHGGGKDDTESDYTGGNIVRKYRKRCLEHQKRITELEKENSSLKQKIKELSK